MLKIPFTRVWQVKIISFLILINVSIGILGIYTLRTSPALSFDSGVPFHISWAKIRKIEYIKPDPTFFLRLPEFFTPKEEINWWHMQDKLYTVLMKNSSVMVEFTEKNGIVKEIEAAVGFMSLLEVIERTGLIYLAALIYIISAVSVFQRHRSTSGLIFAVFLLSGALYLISSAPVVNRSITLYTPYLKILINFIYISAGGMITLVHFAFVFPRPKDILRRFPAIPYIFYGYFLLTVILYLSGIIAFGTPFPFLCLWILVMIGAFLHSLIKERDPFLRKQTRLSLLAPLMASTIFILLNILPGVLGMTSMSFTYFALFSLVLPFALPSAMENLRLYQERLEMEHRSQMEKERIRQELHDNLGNDLTNIKFLSEVAGQSLPDEPDKAGDIIRTIKQITLKNIEQLRDFLWAVDIEEETMDDVISHFKSYTTRLFNPLNIDIEFKTPLSSGASHLSTHLRFNLFNIYKEAMTNIIKHSKVKRVEVELGINKMGLELRIADDGVGFDPGLNPKGCYGLKNMKKRAKEIGAALNISSKDGKGTEIYLTLPPKYLI